MELQEIIPLRNSQEFLAIADVVIFPNIWSVFGTANRPNINKFGDFRPAKNIKIARGQNRQNFQKLLRFMALVPSLNLLRVVNLLLHCDLLLRCTMCDTGILPLKDGFET